MKRPKITLDEVFAILERYAAEGKRCPENGAYDISNAMLPSLAREGRILIEVSGQNYRTVKILVGPHAGKSTAPNPRGARVWRTIGTETVVDVHPGERPSRARQPSTLPRF